MGKIDVYHMVDLRRYYNSDAVSSDSDRTDGDFNGIGQTYPEEDLPSSNSLFDCDGIVFRFPDKRDGMNNNVSLEGQHIAIPEDTYDTLYVLGAAERDFEDNVSFITADGCWVSSLVGLSSWHKGNRLQYGEKVAVRCSGVHCPTRHVYTDRLGVDYGIWIQRVPIDTRMPLAAIELPDNPGMHVFALTLRRMLSSVRAKIE